MAGTAERIYVVKSGDAPFDYFKYKRPSDNVQTDLLSAYNQAVDGRNDTIILTPSNHQLGASLAWSKNMTHLVGSYKGSKLNIRNRIGMSTTFTPMFNISGYGNTFADIYTMHGTAAADLVGWLISGNRNSFFNCHFGGPMAAAQDLDGYIGVHLNGGQECYFNGCVFGTDTIARDQTNENLQVEDTARLFLDYCNFLAFIDGANPWFVTVDNDAGVTQIFMRGCWFQALSSNMAQAMDDAFNITGGSTCIIAMDGMTNFVGVTRIADATDDTYIYLPRVHSTTTDTAGQISVQLSI